MMASIGRNAVRFKDTPAFVRVPDDMSMSSADSATTLMKALQLDESSSTQSEVVNDKSIISDSPSERNQWVGRTPHAKVLDAKRSRKALEDLMKMPELAPLNNSVMVTPFVFREQSNGNTPSDISFSPAAVPERSQVAGTPYVEPVKGNNVFLNTPFFQQSETPTSLARSTPSSNESYSFDLLSTEADRVLSALPDITPTSSRSAQNFISPLSEPSVGHPRLAIGNYTPAPKRNQEMSFEEEDSSALTKSMVKSATKPLRTWNQNTATFEKPKQVMEDSTSKYIKNAVINTPVVAASTGKENQHQPVEVDKKMISDVKALSERAVSLTNTVASKRTVRPVVGTVRDEQTVSFPSKTLFQESTIKPNVEASLQTLSEEVAVATVEVKPKSARSVMSMNVDLPETNNKPPEFITLSNNEKKVAVAATENYYQETQQPQIQIATDPNFNYQYNWQPNGGIDEGVSLGKGPIFACIRAKKVEHYTTRSTQSVECKEKFVPAFPIDAPSIVQTKQISHQLESNTKNSLHLANIWATPRNTRKSVPHSYFVNDRVEAPKMVSHCSSALGPQDKIHMLNNKTHVSTITVVETPEQPKDIVITQQPIMMNVPSPSLSVGSSTPMISHQSTLQEANMSTSTQIVSSVNNVHQDVSIQVDREFFLNSNKTMQHPVVPTMKDMAVQSSFDSSVSILSPIGKVVSDSAKNIDDCIQGNIVIDHLNETPKKYDMEESICSYTLEDLLPKYSSAQHSRIIASYTSTPSSASPVAQQKFDTKSCYVERSNKSCDVEKATSFDVSASTSMIQNRSTNLGSATRVVVSDREKYMKEQWQNQQIPWDYFNEYEDPVDESCNDEVDAGNNNAMDHKDFTLLTDVAVASFTQTMIMDDEESNSVGCNTTFTLDQSCDLSKSSCHSDATAEQVFPKLAIKSLKRAADSPLDVKEINFDTAPGEYTTVMLTFSNHRSRDLTFFTDCAFLRVEPSYYARSSGAGGEFACIENGEEYFTVSPKVVTIPANGQGVVFVTFSPVAEKEGIYSGVMRIKYSNKSYTMLLRGESSFDFSVSSPTVMPSANDCADRVAVDPASLQPTMVEKVSSPVVPAQSTKVTSHLITPGSVFQKKLKALQDQIAAISQRVLWGEETPNKSETPVANSSIPAQTGSATSATVTSSASAKMHETNKVASSSSVGPQSIKSSSSCYKMSSASDVLLFPPTMSFTVANVKYPLTLSNNTNRPKIIRLATSMPQNILLSTTFATVLPNSQYKVDVHIEKLTREVLQSMHGINMKKISKHEVYHFGSIECSFDNHQMMVPVSIHGSLLKPLLLQVPTPASVASKSLTWTMDTKGGDGPSPAASSKVERSDLYDGDFEATRLKQSSIMSTPQQLAISNSDSYLFDHQSNTQKSLTTGVNATEMVKETTNSDRVESKVIHSHLQHMHPSKDLMPISKAHEEGNAGVDLLTQHNYIEFNHQPQQSLAIIPSHFSSGNSIASSCVTSHKQGLYFRKSHAQFGSVAVGNLVRTKIELCNPSNHELIVYLGTLKTPFVVLHEEVHMRPRSFIRIPVRFVPTMPGEFSTELIAQTSDGKQINSIMLSGSCYL